MMKPRALQEIRVMEFRDIYDRRIRGGLTVREAAEILGICERTFRRWCRSYEEEGEEGLSDRRLGRIANNAAPVDEVIKMLNLYESRYSEFVVKHFYEKWREEHGGKRCYTWVKNHLQREGLVKRLPKKGAHRKKRPRRPMEGMMLLQDGSDHNWIAEERWDLVITIDDASSKVCSGFFVKEEGTWSSFLGVKEVIERYGIFCSLYTDRASHYWNTVKAGGKVDRSNLTQFGRAMRQLGIEMIPSYSPEARGRIERMFQTLQKRLPQELKLAGITDMKQANIFLQKQFWPDFNRRFMAKPQEENKAFIPLLSNLQLDDILCIQERRIVAKDNTVNYHNKILQIEEDKYRYNYAKTQVMIHEYMDGSMAIFYGHRCLGRYDNNGELLETTSATQLSTRLLGFNLTTQQPVDNCLDRFLTSPISQL